MEVPIDIGSTTKRSVHRRKVEHARDYRRFLQLQHLHEILDHRERGLRYSRAAAEHVTCLFELIISILRWGYVRNPAIRQHVLLSTIIYLRVGRFASRTF